MRMHYIRLWRKIEMFTVGFLFLAALSSLIFLKMLGVFFILWVACLLILVVGYVSRKQIEKRSIEFSSRIGLRRITLFKIKESKESAVFEIHVLPASKPLGNTVQMVQMRILRDFISDVKQLNDYAVNHTSAEVTFFGTSHNIFLRAWENAWGKLGVECKFSNTNLDSKGTFTQKTWIKVLKSYYGDVPDLRFPDPHEWRTITCKIKSKRSCQE